MESKFDFSDMDGLIKLLRKRVPALKLNRAPHFENMLTHLDDTALAQSLKFGTLLAFVPNGTQKDLTIALYPGKVVTLSSPNWGGEDYRKYLDAALELADLADEIQKHV